MNHLLSLMVVYTPIVQARSEIVLSFRTPRRKGFLRYYLKASLPFLC